MKAKSGFTLFEIVITLLVMFVVVSYMIPILNSSVFRYDQSVRDIQESIDMRTVVENITHDYVNQCFEDTPFTLETLRNRIGRSNNYIIRSGSDPFYHPYGFNGAHYIPYFVKYNEFVEESEKNNQTNFIRDYNNKRMLLVTIQPSHKSNNSLTVLFSKKTKP